MKYFQYIIIIGYSTITCSAQNMPKTEFFLGGCFQTTVMNFFDFNKVFSGTTLLKAQIPHNYERNIQGLGIPLVLRYNLNQKYSIDLSPTFRYDEIYFQLDTNQKRSSFKEIILNSSVCLNKIFSKRNHVFKVGISVFNIGKTMPTFLKVPQIQRINLQFSTFNLGIQFNLKKYQKHKIDFETNLISKGKIFVLDDNRSYISYNIRYLYKLN